MSGTECRGLPLALALETGHLLRLRAEVHVYGSGSGVGKPQLWAGSCQAPTLVNGVFLETSHACVHMRFWLLPRGVSEPMAFTA